ncbi:hypothetical protein GF380_02590 [Candidatus Uhrbacteria bacterium]|nr:hypothetical protein [Candidatus Uhrbacteria bacterium]
MDQAILEIDVYGYKQGAVISESQIADYDGVWARCPADTFEEFKGQTQDGIYFVNRVLPPGKRLICTGDNYYLGFWVISESVNQQPLSAAAWEASEMGIKYVVGLDGAEEDWEDSHRKEIIQLYIDEANRRAEWEDNIMHVRFFQVLNCDIHTDRHTGEVDYCTEPVGFLDMSNLPVLTTAT